MAPSRARLNRKSIESNDSVNMAISTDHSLMYISKSRTPTRTPPSRSPIKKALRGINQKQKRALIDNLQLEITERARKLRAQYAMQAQGLRSRVELRVNRIPTSMRNKTMGELFSRHADLQKPQVTLGEPAASARPKLKNSPTKNLIQVSQSHELQASPSPMRKRNSDEMLGQENLSLSNPKRRVLSDRDATGPPTSLAAPDKVLSPRSPNSRTLIRSPTRPSPVKSFLTRPISPSKPAAPHLAGGATAMLHNMVEKAKTSRAAAATKKATTTSRAKKAGATSASGTRAAKGRASNSSLASDASSGTVVTAPVKQPPIKRSVMGTIKGGIAGAKKAAAAHKTSAATNSTTGTTTRRVLRSRA